MKLRDNASRAKNAKLMMKVILFGLIIGAVYSIWELYELSKLPSYYDVNSEYGEFGSFDLVALLNGLYTSLFGVCQIVAAVVFIKWFRRAYWNLHEAEMPGLRYSEGWAAGGWFVPILGLFYPYRIMVDIKESLIRLKTASYRFDKSKIQMWWGFYLANISLHNVAGRLLRKAETVSDYIAAETLSLIAAVPGVIAAYYVIQLIEEISSLENEIYPKLEEKLEESELEEAV